MLRIDTSKSRFWLLIVAIFYAAFTLRSVAAEETARLGPPRINVIFLDDSCTLDTGGGIRRNHWTVWDQRLPVFQHLLVTLVAEFQKAQGDTVAAGESLFGIEISSHVSDSEKDALIADELTSIHEATGRNSAIFARSSQGSDQLRLVFQDSADYRPEDAAKFLRVLAEISPPVAHARIAECFGPFQPPPTIIFDPRVDVRKGYDGVDPAISRWGLLEREVYMLPHYVLHTVAVLNDSVSESRLTFYSESRAEPGSNTFIDVVIAPPGQLTSNVNSIITELRGNNPIRTVDASDFIRNPNSFLGQDESLRIVVNTPREFTTDHFIQNTDAYKTLNALQNLGQDFEVFSQDFIGAKTATKAYEELNIHNPLTTFDATSGGLVGVPPVPMMDIPWQAKRLGDMHSLGEDLADLGANNILTIGTMNKHFVNAMQMGGDGDLNMLIADPTEVSKSWGGSIPVFGGPGLSGEFSPRATDNLASQMALEYLAGKSSFSLPSDNISGALQSLHAGIDTTSQPGGILFDKDNAYELELTDALRRKFAAVLESYDSGNSSSEEKVVGLRMTSRRPRLVDDLMVLWIDGKAKPAGCLPAAIPRFLSFEPADEDCFGGTWTMEPAKISQQLDLILVPAETRSRLRYVSVELGQSNDGGEELEGPSKLYFAKEGSRFQPPLRSRNDKGVDWVLRHGVTIEFNRGGLVQAIRSPKGEWIRYVREGGHMTGQEFSDGRSIDIATDPTTARPTGAVHMASSTQNRLVSYKYSDGGQLEETTTPAGTRRILYGPGGRPVELDGVALGRDERGRLTELATPSDKVAVEYFRGTNAIEIDRDGTGREWRFGPRSGVITDKRAVQWTRNIQGRIIQLAWGAIKSNNDKLQFAPTEIIGTKAATENR